MWVCRSTLGDVLLGCTTGWCVIHLGFGLGLHVTSVGRIHLSARGPRHMVWKGVRRRLRLVSFVGGHWEAKAPKRANARVDWLAMEDDDITKKFPILLVERSITIQTPILAYTYHSACLSCPGEC